MPDPTTLPGTTDPNPAGGSAQATGTAGGGSAGGSTGETAEQKMARIEAEKKELERKNAQLLSEKSGVEQKARELEEKERTLKTQPPATREGEDPRIANLRQLEQFAAAMPDNPIVIASLENTRASIRADMYQKALTKLDAELLQKPAALRDTMKALMLSGEVATLEAAESVARERANRGLEEKLAQAEKEKAELQRDLDAQRAGRVGIGGRPAFDSANSSTPRMKRRDFSVKIAELQDRANKGDKAARAEGLKMLSDRDNRKLILTDD